MLLDDFSHYIFKSNHSVCLSPHIIQHYNFLTLVPKELLRYNWTGFKFQETLYVASELKVSPIGIKQHLWEKPDMIRNDFLFSSRF